MQGPPLTQLPCVCARIWLKDGGFAKTDGRERKCGKKESLNALNNALAAHTNIKRERKKERAQERKLSLTA